MDASNVLAVAAYIDVDGDPHDSWVARVMTQPDTPFAGMFAFGSSFADARKTLAQLVWQALCSGSEGVSGNDVDAVRILALTRKTFAVGDLSQATS